MFELKDFSSRFHDGFLNKYADSSGPSLDFYISDSLQDMLDIDIYSEVATLIADNNECSPIDNDFHSSYDPGDSISSDQNTVGSKNINNAPCWRGPTWSPSNDFYADISVCVDPVSVMPFINSTMLHRLPKRALNIHGFPNTSSPPKSPVENKNQIQFSSPKIKTTSQSASEQNATQTSQQTNIFPQQKNFVIETTKQDSYLETKRSPTNLISNIVVSSPSIATSSLMNNAKTIHSSTPTQSLLNPTMAVSTSNVVINSNNVISTNSNTIKLGPGIGGLTFANSITYNKLKQQSITTKTSAGTLTANGNTIVLKRDRDSSPLHNMATLNGSTTFHGNQLSTKILARNVVNAKNISPATHIVNSSSGPNANQRLVSLTPTIINAKPSKNKTPVVSEYPKPAYSYSCLIAMALKNSRSGSLPVSKVYSFMCEHFPYFKTAHSGWKNSVRHNLSTSKCFNKVEKPVPSGAQRKGCLWAMVPEKISKMDEEVQKWSRKDPMAIRNAMVFPENLESLERGEMKHGSTGDSDVELDSQSEVEETSDSEELDQELDETIVETHDMYVEEDDDSGPQQHRDFDIEVEDIYDAIDMEDDKDAVRLAINANDIIEMSSSPSSSIDNDCNSPKRARLNINYSIGPAGEVHQQFKQNVQHHMLNQNHQHQQQILTTATFQPQNRRKMQLVNRIA